MGVLLLFCFLLFAQCHNWEVGVAALDQITGSNMYILFSEMSEINLSIKLISLLRWVVVAAACDILLEEVARMEPLRHIW